MFAATIRMVAALADYIDHAGLLVGGAPNCRASRQAETWLLAATIRMVAALVVQVDDAWLLVVAQIDHAWLLVSGTSGA